MIVHYLREMAVRLGEAYNSKFSCDQKLQILGCIYRLIIVWTIGTTFMPDEYYQYVEPSYSVAFGSGIKTWEWEPDNRIRSFIPLLPLIVTYKALQTLGLDCEWCLRIVPRLLFTLLAVYADTHYMQLCKYLLDSGTAPTGEKSPVHTHHTRAQDHPPAHPAEHVHHHSETFSAAQCAYVIHLLSWSLSYCLPRTLGNSLETCLLIIGTSLLLIPPPHDDYKLHIWSISALARKQRHDEMQLCEYRRQALAVFVICTSIYCRPTAALLWMPLGCMKLWNRPSPLSFILKTALPVRLLVLQVFVLVDTHLYGNVLTIAPLRFYAANVSKNYAAYFGVQPWHWNFTQGLPVVLGVYTPMVIYGLLRPSALLSDTIKLLCGVSLFYAVGLSVFSAHQEIRFLLPCLPFLHVVAGIVLHDLLVWCRSASHRKALRFKKNLTLLGILVVFLAQLCGVIFLIGFHQCGTERAMSFVGADIKAQAHHHHHSLNNSEGLELELPVVNVYIAAPCHSFPGYAGLHLPQPLPHHVASSEERDGTNSALNYRNGSETVALPAVTIHTSPCYLNLDAADHFDAAPERHLSSLLDAPTHTPGDTAVYSVDYVLTFDSYHSALDEILHKNHFEQVAQFQHAYFRYDLDDPHFKQQVLMFRRKKVSVKVSYDAPSGNSSDTSTTVPSSSVPITDTHTPTHIPLDTSNVHTSTAEEVSAPHIFSTASATASDDATDAAEQPGGSTGAETEPSTTPSIDPSPERKYAPFRAFVAAGGTLAAMKSRQLMQDIELEDLLN